MLKAIMLRKASLFGQQAWLEVPWQDRAKPAEQQVFDLGFQLAVVLERADQLAEAEAYAEPIEDTINLLQTSNNLQSRLEDGYVNLYKPVLQARRHEWFPSNFDEVLDISALTTADISHIMIVINLWASQLLLGFVAEALRLRLIEALESRLLLDAQREDVKSICDVSALYTSQHTLTDLAHATLKYLPSCIASRASEFAASRTFFPLTCILWQFRHFEVQFAQAISLMRQISEARNLRFADRGYSLLGFFPPIIRGDEGLMAPKARSSQ